MTEEIQRALIAAAGTAVGAVLAAFKDEIKNTVFGLWPSKHAYLKGVWTCTWDVSTPAQAPTIHDQITIEKTRGSSIKGKGQGGSYGQYDVDGRVGQYVITCQYDGRNNSKGLCGVVILKKVSNVYLQGVWSQYAEKGELKGGSTEWRK